MMMPPESGPCVVHIGYRPPGDCVTPGRAERRAVEVSDPLEGSRLFAHVARDLAEQHGLDRTIQRLLELATQLTGCDIAAIWQLSPAGHTTLQGASDHTVAHALDPIITGVDEGLVHHALTRRATVHMSV